MEIIQIETERIIPYSGNARKHSDEQINRIAQSIDEFGFNQPLVVDEKCILLVGHGRLAAAKKLGMTQIWAYQITGLTDAQKRAYRILDNRLAEEAEWDFESLQEEVELLEADDYDIDGWDLHWFCPEEVTLTVEDQTDGLAAALTTNIQIGDLIQMGEHFLLCGDSGDSGHVQKLMGDKRAGLMNTDPPYGIAYTDKARLQAERAAGRPGRVAKWLGGIENDQHVDENIQAFLEKTFKTAAEYALLQNAAWYLWHANLTAAFFAAAAAAADVLLHRQIVWVKPALVFGSGDYHWRHECCFYGWKQGSRPEFYGERSQTSVWEITHDTSNGNRIHPTQKPLELFAIPIRNHTKQGEIIYEPFAGSGSQLIAADQLGRICYGMEIAPTYCQVIVDRYIHYRKANGLPHNVLINGQRIDTERDETEEKGISSEKT